MSQYVVRPLREKDIESIIAIDALVTGVSGPDRAGFWRGLLSIHAVPPEVGDGVLEVEEPPAPAPYSQAGLCEVAETAAPRGVQVVGFIIGDVQSWQFGLPRHGRIVTIGVHPDHRRKGVARLLAESLLGSFRTMGLPFVHCLDRPGDPLGELFRSLGFSRPGVELLEKKLQDDGSGVEFR